MNWAWVSSLDHIWRSPTFPMWLTLAAAGFFGLIVLITLLRAEKSVANGALTVITLLSIGVAGVATIRSFEPAGSAEGQPVAGASAALPQLSCIDDLAGEAVLSACEKTLFGSAEFDRVGGRLCGLPDHPADRFWRCGRKKPQFRTACAPPCGRARPLWADGLCADGPRPLHGVILRRVPLAVRQSSDRGQHGRARL